MRRILEEPIALSADRKEKLNSRSRACISVSFSEVAIQLKTRVFELSNGKYANIQELARAMGVSWQHVYKVRQGKRRVNRKFIIGAIKAFPGISLMTCFMLPQRTTSMTPDNRSGLPRIIKQQRIMRELTLSKLSAMSGVSASELGRIERRERFPSATILRKIAKPLDLAESELFIFAGYLSPPTLQHG